MKKLFALFLAMVLCLVMINGIAEDVVTLDWEANKDICDDAGNFWELNAAAVQLWVPDALAYTEVTDEMLANDIVILFTDGAGHAVYAQYIEAESADVDGLYAEFAADPSFIGVGYALVNGVAAVRFSSADDNTALVAFPTQAGNALVFGVTGVQDSDFVAAALKVLSSITAVEQ